MTQRLLILFATVVLVAGLPCLPVAGQGLPTLLKRLSINVPALSMFVEPAPLTSGLETAVSGIGIAVLDLARIDFAPMADLARDQDGIVTLQPGAWELLTESVSLLPGSAAPIQAEGFVYAPMAGPRADLIRAVLLRTYRTPEVTLDDAQSVLWMILSRARISDLAPAFRPSAERLLTAGERASIDAAALGDLPDDLRAEVREKLPTPLASLVIAEASLRQTFANPPARFADVSRVAVPAGDPESIMGDRDLIIERWSYHPDGYFIRFLPEHYRRTAIQIVVPSGLRPAIQRDGALRVTRVAYPGGLEVTAEYDTTTTSLALQGDPNVHGYAFKSLTVSEPDPVRPGQRRSSTIPASGWTLVGRPNGVADFGPGGRAALQTSPRYVAADEHYQSGWWVSRGLSFVSGDKEPVSGMLDSDPDAIDETYFRDAASRVLRTAPPDAQWARVSINRVIQAFDWAYCTMQPAACQTATTAPDRRPVKRFDPTVGVAVPGRQGSQRLGMTGRVVK